MLDTIGKNLDLSQLFDELVRFGHRVNKFGVSFAVCDIDGELILLCDRSGETIDRRNSQTDKYLTFKSADQPADHERFKEYSIQALDRSREGNSVGTDAGVYRLGQHNQVLAVVLKSDARDVGVALIDLGNKVTDTDLSAENCQSIAVGRYTPDGILSEMLCLLADNFQVGAKAEKQIEMVSTELAQTYEELVLLHKLSTNMKVTETDAKLSADGV